MAETLLFRGGSTADVNDAATTVSSREIVIDTDTNQIVSGPNKKRTIMNGDGITIDPNNVAISTNGQGRLSIDSSGRLLVGTSSIASGGYVVAESAHFLVQGRVGSSTDSGRINIQRGSVPTISNQGIGGIYFTDSSNNGYASIESSSDGTTGTNDYPGRLVFSTTADGASSPTERMRIDSSGTVLIGKTSSNFTVNGCELSSTGGVFTRTAEAITINRQGSDGIAAVLRRSNVTVGSISVTTSATAYNTSSDYRLKENVVPLTGAVDRLKQLPVRRFNFIADPDTTVDGFIAHEAQAVVPECVTGAKDEVDADGNPVYQGIDQSKLVPLLTAALQEAMERIEVLEAKVNALEGN
ncbi:hypothetical protein SXGG_00013 [Synechococcus phage S-CBP42]|uniref:Peptidase S74 domain-containing protein n=1 Tax=Synechococcus phage S-CBP42 TaxID=461711 RepID=G8EYD3_9CAUD|nr:tail fiber protein [Synechococcus phage S-CBP42]AET72513.1 hypothetical protein SXGG_00013 [Synechococcus phage S-CBP42]AGK86674.1 hypothetical protein S-CBP42_0022 [Synechococcus phage S-CBP42]